MADLPESRDDAGAVLAKVAEEFPGLPLIVLAHGGDGSSIFVGPSETSGTRRTLHKPFKLSDLLTAARNVLLDPVESTPD